MRWLESYHIPHSDRGRPPAAFTPLTLRRLRAQCEHNWVQDPHCDLVDQCSKCGEGRA
jgi:hypothetical protein